MDYLVPVDSTALQSDVSTSPFDLLHWSDISHYCIFIGLSACLNFPATFLVVSNSCFVFPRAVASSGSFARLSITFTVSVFTIVFTALFDTVYCPWAAAFVDRVILLYWLLGLNL